MSHQLYRDYHDQEWGVPEYEDRALFEKLLLDGAQAGLSWWTILNKRENYREAFDHFDAEKMSSYDQTKIDQLLNNAGIIRNKLKVNAFVSNAKLYIDFKSKGGSFRDYLWEHVDGKPLVNQFKTMSDVPATSAISDQLSKRLKKDGYKFVGSTIIYAYMQAIGMVNDHLVDCPRHHQIINNYN